MFCCSFHFCINEIEKAAKWKTRIKLAQKCPQKEARNEYCSEIECHHDAAKQFPELRKEHKTDRNRYIRMLQSINRRSVWTKSFHCIARQSRSVIKLIIFEHHLIWCLIVSNSKKSKDFSDVITLEWNCVHLLLVSIAQEQLAIHISSFRLTAMRLALRCHVSIAWLLVFHFIVGSVLWSLQSSKKRRKMPDLSCTRYTDIIGTCGHNLKNSYAHLNACTWKLDTLRNHLWRYCTSTALILVWNIIQTKIHRKRKQSDWGLEECVHVFCPQDDLWASALSERANSGNACSGVAS